MGTPARRRSAGRCPAAEEDAGRRAGHPDFGLPGRAPGAAASRSAHQVVAVGPGGEGAVVAARAAERHVDVDPDRGRRGPAAGSRPTPGRGPGLGKPAEGLGPLPGVVDHGRRVPARPRPGQRGLGSDRPAVSWTAAVNPRPARPRSAGRSRRRGRSVRPWATGLKIRWNGAASVPVPAVHCQPCWLEARSPSTSRCMNHRAPHRQSRCRSLTKKLAATMRARLWTHPSARSWRMAGVDHRVAGGPGGPAGEAGPRPPDPSPRQPGQGRLEAAGPRRVVEEDVGVELPPGRRRFGTGRPRALGGPGRQDLTGVQAAEAQVRREAGWSPRPPAGPAPVVGRPGARPRRPRAGPGPPPPRAAGSGAGRPAGRPTSRAAAWPTGPPGRPGRRRWPRRATRRVRGRAGRGPPGGRPPPVEGRKDRDRGPRRAHDGARGQRVGRAHGLEGPAVGGQGPGHPGVPPAAVGGGVGRHEDLGRPDLGGQRRHHLDRVAGPHDQPAAHGPVQLGQAAGQEGGPGPTGRGARARRRPRSRPAPRRTGRPSAPPAGPGGRPAAGRGGTRARPGAPLRSSSSATRPPGPSEPGDRPDAAQPAVEMGLHGLGGQLGDLLGGRRTGPGQHRAQAAAE